MEPLLSILSTREAHAPQPWPDAVPSLFVDPARPRDESAQRGIDDADALCLVAVLPTDVCGWQHAMLVCRAARSVTDTKRVWVAASTDFTAAGRAIRQDAHTLHQNWQGLTCLARQLSVTLSAEEMHRHNLISLHDASLTLLDLARGAVVDGSASTLGMVPTLGRDLPDQLRNGAVGRYIPQDGPPIHAVFLNARDTLTLFTKVALVRRRTRARLSTPTLENAAAKQLARSASGDGFDTAARALPRHLHRVVAAHALDQACQRDDRTAMQIIAHALGIKSTGLAGRRLSVAVALAIDHECA